MKHEVRDRLVITNEFYGHGFEIGTEVTVTAVSSYDYKVEGPVGEFWWVQDDEVEKLEEIN